jgi:ATP-dependent DNA helicase RecG
VSQLSLSFPSHYALLSPDEIYDAVDEKLLTKLAEDRRLERKPPGMHSKDLARWFSMWANTPPEGGIIVVGMEDKGQFSGCHGLSSDQLNKLEKGHYTYVPDARVDSKRIAVAASDGSDSFVVVFRIRYREDKVVHTVSGEAFIRRGDECHELTKEEIRELEIDRRQVDIEKEPVTLTYPDDFDADLIRRFIEGVKKVHQPLQNYDDITVFGAAQVGPN